MISIGFTGTRTGLTTLQRSMLDTLFSNLPMTDEVELHHGDCLGADDQADELAVKYKFSRIVIHPPLNTRGAANCSVNRPYKHREVTEPDEFIARNHAIVDSCVGLIACPKGFNEELRSGTWATIRYAKKTGKDIIIILPDGRLEAT